MQSLPRDLALPVAKGRNWDEFYDFVWIPAVPQAAVAPSNAIVLAQDPNLDDDVAPTQENEPSEFDTSDAPLPARPVRDGCPVYCDLVVCLRLTSVVFSCTRSLSINVSKQPLATLLPAIVEDEPSLRPSRVSFVRHVSHASFLPHP
jgi:hypothetical protein